MLTDHQFNFILESFDQKEKIKSWLDEMKIKNYSINDLTVDVNDNVCINYGELKKIPVQFDRVSGNFSCYNNRLTTLKGAPKSVGGDFWCDNNQLTTLEGAPKSVGGYFVCENNQLTTLKGAPDSVVGDFWCNHNQLTTLEGAPKNVGGNFYCNYNPLKSLKGKPNHVGGVFLIDVVAYDRIFKKDKEWSLDDIDEIPAGSINIKDEIY